MTDVKSMTEHKVVVGVDGSKSSLLALEWATTYAEALHLKVRAVSAYHFPVDYGYYSYTPPVDDDLAMDAKNRLATTIADLKTKHPTVEFEAETVNAAPAQALIEDSKDAELLVVGSRGHGGFLGMLVGSVSLNCISHAHCPVVVLRGVDYE
jgi:nucleotide-binding universal stress UspA family protein